MRRMILVAALMLALVAVSAAPVSAGEEWCDADPVLVVVTPHGAIVPLFVDTGAQGGLLNLPIALLAVLQTQYTAHPGPGGRGTVVDLAVTVPHIGLLSRGSFATRTVVSSGPFGTGTVYGRATGTSGRVMHVTFTLPVA